VTEELIESNISTGFKNILNKHGYGFQYSVLRHILKLREERKIKWAVEGAEFPVVTKTEVTHIDFILRGIGNGNFMICECKRVDPAKGNWCFAKAPFTSKNQSHSEIIFDQFLWISDKGWTQRTCIHNTQYDIFHIGLEQKTDLKGDGTSHRENSINDAVTQVLRGSSGLINHLCDDSRRLRDNEVFIRIIPGIFTTAQLSVTEEDIGEADLHNGLLPTDSFKINKVNWIWYNYNRSPNLGHKVNPELPAAGINLPNELKNEFVRSIAIINSDGIDEFLTINYPDFLDDF
jgi:hypothetical protein